MVSLGAGLAGLGGVPGGYISALDDAAQIEAKKVATDINRQRVQSAQLDLQGQAAFGNALRLLSGQGGGQQPGLPAPQPGQASQPQQPPLMAGAQPTVPSGPQMGGGTPAIPPGTVPRSPPPSASGGGEPGASPSRQPSPTPQEGGAPAQGFGRQPLSLQTIVAAVTRANPGASPGVIARAVDGFMPLMKQEEQMYWQQERLKLLEADLKRKTEQGGRALDIKQEGLNLKADIAAKNLEIANRRVDIAERRMAVAETEEERKLAKQEFDQGMKERDAALKEQAEARRERFGQARIDVAREKIESTERQTGARIESAERQTGAKLESAERRTDAQLASREAIARMNAETKIKLFEAGADLKEHLQERAIQGKFDLTTMSNEAKQWLAQFNAEQKKAIAEYLETGRTERQKAGLEQRERERGTREKIATERTQLMSDLARHRFDIQNKRLNIQEDRMYGVDAEKQKTVLANAGITPERLEADAKNFNMTGRKPVSTGMPSVARAAYDTAVTNRANQMLSDQGLEPGAARAQAAASYKAAQKTIDRFIGAGPQGDSARFLGVAQSHIQTLRTLAQIWASGDVQRINQFKAWLGRELGQAIPVDMEAAAHVLGTEIIKSLAVARAGTAQEREEIAKTLSARLSPEQLLGSTNRPGVLDTYERLLGGQLNGLKRQFVGGVASLYPPKQAEAIFDAMITDEGRKTLTEKKGDLKWRTPLEQFDAENQRKEKGLKAGTIEEARQEYKRKYGREPEKLFFYGQGTQPFPPARQYQPGYGAPQE